MKTILAAFAGSLLLSSVAMAKETTTAFRISGWHCEDCSEKTVDVVKQIKGVKDATVDFAGKKLTVVYDDEQTTTTDIGRAVTTLHYKSYPIEQAAAH